MILLNCITLAWWITNFSPYQDFLRKRIKPHIPLSLSYLSVALSCFMCHSFWLTLVWTQDFFLAAGAAMIAYTYDRIMNGIKQYL
jgi:hypothetical protein